MNVLNFIKKNGIETIVSQYKLKHKIQMIDDNKKYHILNYSNNKMDEVTNQCRGIVLKETDSDFTIVYNCMERALGEYVAKRINKQSAATIESCNLVEKIDGSFIKLYWDENKWNLGTRSFAVLDETNTFILSFLKGLSDRDIDSNTNSSAVIFKTVSELSDYLIKYDLPKENSYMFETVGPDNTIVVEYKEYSNYFLNCVNTNTGIYCNTPDVLLEALPSLKVPQIIFKTNTFKIEDVEHYLNIKDLLCNGDKSKLLEGFIAYSSGDNPKPIYKIKSQLYCKYSSDKDVPLSIKSFDSAIIYFKNKTVPGDDVDLQIREYYNEIEIYYNNYVNIINTLGLKHENAEPNTFGELQDKYHGIIFSQLVKLLKTKVLDTNTITIIFFNFIQRNSFAKFKEIIDNHSECLVV
jgi:hypothetical protein